MRLVANTDFCFVIAVFYDPCMYSLSNKAVHVHYPQRTATKARENGTIFAIDVKTKGELTKFICLHLTFVVKDILGQLVGDACVFVSIMWQ